MGKKRLHFIIDETQDWLKKEGDKSLFRLSNTLKELNKDIKINVLRITDPKNRKIDLNDFSKGDGCDDYILDTTNINEFLKENNIKTTYVGKAKEQGNVYDVVITKNKEKSIPMTKDTKELIEKIRNRFVQLTKTESMTFSFDNDIAALPKLPHLKKLCDLLGLESKFLIPTFAHKINDNNDILKKYKSLLLEKKDK